MINYPLLLIINKPSPLYCIFLDPPQGLKTVENQGRNSKPKKTTRHLLIMHSRCRVVYLCSFISALFLYFFRPIPNWNEVLQKLFPNKLARRRARFALVTNALVLETNEWRTSVQTSATHTTIATSGFQTDVISRWLLHSGTHLRKREIATSSTLS